MGERASGIKQRKGYARRPSESLVQSGNSAQLSGGAGRRSQRPVPRKRHQLISRTPLNDASRELRQRFASLATGYSCRISIIAHSFKYDDDDDGDEQVLSCRSRALHHPQETFAQPTSLDDKKLLLAKITLRLNHHQERSKLPHRLQMERAPQDKYFTYRKHEL